MDPSLSQPIILDIPERGQSLYGHFNYAEKKKIFLLPSEAHYLRLLKTGLTKDKSTGEKKYKVYQVFFCDTGPS